MNRIATRAVLVGLVLLTVAWLVEPGRAVRADSGRGGPERFAKVQKWIGTFTYEARWEDNHTDHDTKYSGHVLVTSRAEVEYEKSDNEGMQAWRAVKCRGNGKFEAELEVRSSVSGAHTTQQGSGSGDCGGPFLSINPDNGTYYLDVPTLRVPVTTRESGWNVAMGTSDRTYTEDQTVMDGQVDCCHDVPLPAGLALAGNKTVEETVWPILAAAASQKPGIVRVSWHLAPADMIETEAVISADDDYETWLPEAREDEKSPGNTITVHARIRDKKNPQRNPPQKAKFKFELVDTSRERGVCLNQPPQKETTDKEPGFDLRIRQEDNPDLKVADDGQSAETTNQDYSAQVVVTSFDWGAWARLKVTATQDDGEVLVAHLENDAGKEELVLPKDDNGNHVADSWEAGHAGKAREATADADQVPVGDGDDGDGLSLYEEYRGFCLEGEHERTEPLLKDVFIQDDIGYGWGWFARSQLAPHLVRKAEVGEAEGEANKIVLNFNRGFATVGPQHVLRLANANLDGLFGRAEGGPGTPRKIVTAWIDVARCVKRGPDQLAKTTAHELAHGCNVWHHGRTDYRIQTVRRLGAGGVWRDWSPKESTTTLNVTPQGATRERKSARPGERRREQFPLPDLVLDRLSGDRRMWVAAPGGQESGVEDCIMRYQGRDLYESPQGEYEWQKADGSVVRGSRYGPHEPPGHVFCDSQKGTGVNDPGRSGGPKAGDAIRGNCVAQFCVNDTKHK